MTKTRRKLRRVAIGSAITAGLAMMIAALTLAPMPAGGSSGSDKLYHFVAFASLAVPLPLVRPRLAIWVVLGVIVYGGLIELIQPVVGRQAEWLDLVADTVGAVVGAMTGRQIGFCFRRSWEVFCYDDPMTGAWLAEDPALANQDLAQRHPCQIMRNDAGVDEFTSGKQDPPQPAQSAGSSGSLHAR